MYLWGSRQKQEIDLTKNKTYELSVFPKRQAGGGGQQFGNEQKPHNNWQRQQNSSNPSMRLRTTLE